MPKKCKWNDKCVRYGFTALLDDCGEPDQVQCMTCNFSMCNSNLKPARLKEHQVKHPAAEHEQTFQLLHAKRARYDQRSTLLQLGFKPIQNYFYELPTKWHTSISARQHTSASM